MAKKYLDYDGLLYFWGKLKSYFVPQTRTINNQPLSADVTISVPSAGTGSSYPAMDGTRSLGSNAGYARVDHVHPSDTSRVPTTRTINGHALSANITLNADDVGALPDSTAIPTKTSDLTNDSDFVSDASYVHTDSNYTVAEKTKLAGIEAGAEANVQADWNQTTTTADDYIKNKPTIPTLKNVFGKVKVGGTTIEADTTQDTLELVAGSNVTLTPDATNDKVTIEATDTTYSDFTGATTSAAGTHGLVPAPAADPSGSSELTFIAADGGWKSCYLSGAGGTLGYSLYLNGKDKSTSVIGAAGHIIPIATISSVGLMSPTDKLKLDTLIFTNGVIDSSILPSYIDDVIEAYPRSGATELSASWLSTTSGGSALTPESGKIYVLMADSTSYAANSQFRWSGTAYVKLADGGVSEITNAEIDTIVAS